MRLANRIRAFRKLTTYSLLFLTLFSLIPAQLARADTTYVWKDTNTIIVNNGPLFSQTSAGTVSDNVRNMLGSSDGLDIMAFKQTSGAAMSISLIYVKSGYLTNGIILFKDTSIPLQSITITGQAPISGAKGYIQGRIVYNNHNHPLGFVKFTLESVDKNGKISPINAFAGTIANPDSTKMNVTDVDGNFVTANNMPSGKYRLTVNQNAKEYFDSLGAFTGGAGGGALAGGAAGVTIVALCIAIPGCQIGLAGGAAVVAGIALFGAAWNWAQGTKEDIDKGGELRIYGQQYFDVGSPAAGNSSIYMATTLVRISPIMEAMSNTIKWLGDFVSTGLRVTMGWIISLLNKSEDYVLGTGVNNAWVKIRNLAMVLLVLALIIIAFANTAGVDLEQYGLNRMIPRIIISIVMAFGSWIVVLFFFDLSSAIQGQAWGLISGNNALDVLQTIQIQTPSAGGILGSMGSILVLLFLLVGVWVCAIILLFLLLLRIVFLSFLLAVAPIAMVFNIMPFTQNLYKQWWSEFWKWMFMGPMAVAIIALGSLIASGMISGSTLNGVDGNEQVLIGLLILAASMVVAATLPLQWGGKIMQSWGKFGKNTLWGKTGGAALGAAQKSAGAAAGRAWQKTGLPGGIKAITSERDRKAAQQAALASNRVAQGLTGGRVGSDQDVIERKLYDAEVKTAGDNMGASTAGQPKLISRFNNPKTTNPYEKQAIMREMASQGDLEKLYADQKYIDQSTGAWVTPTADKETERDLYDAQDREIEEAKHAARVEAGKAFVDQGGHDSILEKTVGDNQGELVVAARNALKDEKDADGNQTARSAYATARYGGLMAGQKNKSLKDKRMNMLEELEPGEAAGFVTSEALTNVNSPTGSSDKVRSKIGGFIDRMDTAGRGDEVPDHIRATGLGKKK